MAGLLEVLQRLSRPQEGLAAVMREVRTAARRLTGADGITFVLREGDHVFYADEDAIGPLWKGRRFEAASCISGWCMTHREAVIVEDVEADPRIPQELYRPTFVRSLALVPVRTDDPLGAIGAYWSGPHRATNSEMFFLEAIASAAAAAVANAELHRELREANRAKDDFLAMLGHELRNPLAPIFTAVHLLRVRGGEAIERERTVIERQVTHLTRLVDDLLDVSRIAHGRIELKREPLEIADVVDRAIEMVSPLFDEKHDHVVASVSREGLCVLGDPVRLAQVIANLLTNAAKYSEQGSQISISAVREGPSVSICVHDSGIGIPPELLPRVFDRFVQNPESLDRARGGLGLGLAITRGFVLQHGGTVSARSEGTGRGAEFIVTLPALDRERAVPL